MTETITIFDDFCKEIIDHYASLGCRTRRAAVCNCGTTLARPGDEAFEEVVAVLDETKASFKGLVMRCEKNGWGENEGGRRMKRTPAVVVL